MTLQRLERQLGQLSEAKEKEAESSGRLQAQRHAGIDDVAGSAHGADEQLALAG